MLWLYTCGIFHYTYHPVYTCGVRMWYRTPGSYLSHVWGTGCICTPHMEHVFQHEMCVWSTAVLHQRIIADRCGLYWVVRPICIEHIHLLVAWYVSHRLRLCATYVETSSWTCTLYWWLCDWRPFRTLNQSCNEKSGSPGVTPWTASSPMRFCSVHWWLSC